MTREYVMQAYRPPVDLQIDYAKELNAQQHAAVTAPPGPALVIAGAGSGKTRTLIFRVAWLLEQGIPADRILLLTFTNKAAREMMRRVAELLGRELPELWGGTFHSIGNRVLRLHADRIQLGRDFSILDRDDAKELIQACVADAGIDTKATRFPKPDLIGDIFSSAMNTGDSIEEIVAKKYGHFSHLAPQIKDLQRRYTERKSTSNAVDFDDLLSLWLRILRQEPDILELYQRRFQFILVDEYQDTNRLQGELIDLLAERNRNIMVVGDDAQSIYAWRGASFENILKFPERYHGATVHKIETNYRSTPQILAVANAAIIANERQFHKELQPSRSPGAKPVLVTCNDSAEQAAFVAQRVLELRDEGMPMSDMAVLYRSHFHALEMQLELTRRNIPFSITSGIRFFEQAHIKDVAAHLKLVVNPRDEVAFKRLAKLLPGIGNKGADKLWSLFSAQHTESTQQGAALKACLPKVPKKVVPAWTQFAETFLQISEVRADAARMIQMVVDAGYEDHLKENYTNWSTRKEDIEQLAIFARQFNSVEDFLAQLALLTNIEADEGKSAAGRGGDDEQLKLSTIHQAKGLEFKVVFVIMLCDGLFPSARSLDEEEGEEEERRLFYVAITRAKDQLYFSHPLLRAIGGYGGGDAMQSPSRFLNEIPKELVEEWRLTPFTS